MTFLDRPRNVNLKEVTKLHQLTVGQQFDDETRKARWSFGAGGGEGRGPVVVVLGKRKPTIKSFDEAEALGLVNTGQLMIFM